MQKLFVILFFLPLAVSAGDKTYEKANRKFYAKVIGNGLEKGVEFKLSKRMPKTELSEVPLPVIEVTNNTAQCIGEIKIDEIKPSPGRFQWVYYYGTIDVVAEEESGGCLGLIRWPVNNNVLKIIDYHYLSEL